MHYKKIGIREAKIQLSKLIKILDKGYLVIITDHGHPVAKLIKPSPEDTGISQKIEELEELNILQKLINKKEYMEIPPPLVLKKIDAQALLQKDRNRE